MIPVSVLRVLLVAASFWLAAACVDEPEVSEPVVEYIDETEDMVRAGVPPTERPNLGRVRCYQPGATEEERWKARSEVQGRTLEVLRTYEQLFRRQPNRWSHGATSLRDENGEYTGEYGVVVRVWPRVPDSQLPLKDRLPGCIGKVPIVVLEEKRTFGYWLTTPEGWRCYELVENDGGPYTEKVARNRARELLAAMSYEELFSFAPHWWSVGTGRIGSQVGIIVSIYPKDPLSELPTEHRIPECIGEVPIEVIERDLDTDPWRGMFECYEPTAGVEREINLLESMKLTSRSEQVVTKYADHWTRAERVLRKHGNLFARQPFDGAEVGFVEDPETQSPVYDERGNAVVALIVRLSNSGLRYTELPPEERLPRCIDGVPIQVKDWPTKIILPVLITGPVMYD